jgi:hypothetical protein
MATKGTDGTDVGTTLTTQGDILYRDGSGLQRLAAGTNGQVLQTGGSGANPSWGTVSSDVVKLASATASSSSYITFEDYYSSTYSHYEIVGHDIQYSTQTSLRFQLAYGAGHTYPTSNYYSLTVGGYTDLGSTTNGSWADYNNNSGGFNVAFDHGASSSYLQHFNANFYNLSATNPTKKTFNCFKLSQNTSWAFGNVYANGYTTESNLISNAITGIRVYPDSGNFVKGNFVLYGYKI